MTEDSAIEPNFKDFSDEHLFKVIASKSENLELAQNAYEEIYRRYAKLIWNLCHSACESFAVVDLHAFIEEVFSQTMIAIYESPTYNSTKGKVSTWISRIAQNKAKDLSKIWTTPIGAEFDIGYDSIEYEEEPEYISLERKLLNKAMEQLSEMEKDILLTYMMYQDGNKHLPDEILNELRGKYTKTSDNIRQIKRRAMVKLHSYIQQSQL